MELSSFQTFAGYQEMIISDAYKFAFIHIPKCGGTDIKFDLRSLDSYDGAFDGLVREYKGRPVDFTHLPLNIVKEEFPDIFSKLTYYETYAVVREPMGRFISAVNQFIKAKYSVGSHEFSDSDFSEVAREIVDCLKNSHDKLDPLLIYFQPQSSFIYFDDVCLVKNLYPIEYVSNMKNDMSKRYDIDFTIRKLGRKYNASLEYRSWIAHAFGLMVPRTVRAQLRKMLPQRALESLRLVLFRPSSRSISALDSETVAFLQGFYQRDLEIYQEASRAHR